MNVYGLRNKENNNNKSHKELMKKEKWQERMDFKYFKKRVHENLMTDRQTERERRRNKQMDRQ